jgi:DNA-binding transcriptional MerR regulator/effector-binding domain-containing protein
MFRIGDFSRLARVTIKTLHHYDEAGLLQPSHVDRQTAYRYYTASQLDTLQRILSLKDLGFALEQIRELLHADAGTWVRTLDRRRAELAASIAADQSRLLRLTALQQTLDHSGTEPPPVVLREVRAVEVYSVRQRVPQLGAPMQALFEEAEAVVAAVQGRSSASPFTVFHDPDYRDADVDVEVCIPVKQGIDRIATHVVPAAAAMSCITYRGPYEQTPLLYSQLLQWLDRSGMRMSGPLREVYHRYGADQTGYRLPASVLTNNSAEYVTELQAPVAPIK